MADSDDGYVLIYRRLLRHPAFRNNAEAMAFAWLVTMAAWKPCQVRYKGKNVTLERGQLALSVRDFAHHMDRDKGWAERLLKRMAEEGIIARQQRDSWQDSGKTVGKTVLTVITICNYEEYQVVMANGKTVNGHDARQQKSEGETQNNKENKLKKEKKEDNPPIVPLKKNQLELPEWLPTEAWDGWVEMRRRKNNSPTDHATKLAIKKLDELRKRGFDAGKVLDNCTLHGWVGIYEPRGGDDQLRAQPRLRV